MYKIGDYYEIKSNKKILSKKEDNRLSGPIF